MVEYTLDSSYVDDKLRKIKKKDKNQFESLIKKIKQIVSNPEAYKPLRGNLKGKYRVYMGHFVLIFSVIKEQKLVILIDYDHHDKIYNN